MLFLLTRRKIFFGLILALTLGAVFVFQAHNSEEQKNITHIPTAHAEHYSGHLANVRGWAWANTPQSPSGGNPQTSPNQGFGWISFSSENCDAIVPFGISDGGPPGCPAAGSSIPPYGVHINPSTGILSGYAWIGEESPLNSGPVGWVSFNPSDFTANPVTNPSGGCPDPDGVCEQANVSTTGAFPRVINGWARVLSMRDPGGKDQNPATSEGWIHLSDTRTDFDISTGLQHPIYQTRIMTQAGEIRGWTWGHDMLGWISFACADGPCGSNIPGNPSTEVFDPTPRNLTNSTSSQNQGLYCQETLTGRNDQLTFSWRSAATTFQIQVDTSGGSTFAPANTWSAPVSSTGGVATITRDRVTVLPLATAGYTSLCGTANCTFYWRVSADEGATWVTSSVTDNNMVTLTSHDWPLVKFTKNKLNLSINEPIEFTDTSTCYDGGAHNCANPGDTFFWTFQDGSPSTSTSRIQQVQFGGEDNDSKDITHTVDDGHGHACTLNSRIIVGTLIPGWKEITP